MTAKAQPPSIADLVRKIPTKWYQVGVLLDIETATLDAFAKQTNDPVQLFIKVFQQWKKDQKVPYTWDTIISTLEKIGEKSTTTNIREWLNAERSRY